MKSIILRGFPMAKVKGKTKGKAKKEDVGISREVWEWARTNPRYESLMEELEDLEDLRREKAKMEKGISLGEVLREYEMNRVQLDQ